MKSILILFLLIQASVLFSQGASHTAQPAAAVIQNNSAIKTQTGQVISPISNLQPSEAVSSMHGEERFDVTAMIAHHLSDAPLWQVDINGFDISITKRVVMMFIVAFLLIIILVPVARLIARNPLKKPTRFTGLFEMLINFIRKDVAEGSIGHHSDPYHPFLLTMFFFILFSNLIGLIPSLGEIVQTLGTTTGLLNVHTGHDSLALPLALKLWPGITATGDIAVTATLAVMSFVVIIISGFAFQGILFIRNLVPNGIPYALWPIMWPIEFIGLFTKPFALAIRLLANMTAGHMIILVFLSFIFQYSSYFLAPISVFGAIAIYMLEIFVGCLQAYIFVFLTALFVAQVQHRH